MSRSSSIVRDGAVNTGTPRSSGPQRPPRRPPLEAYQHPSPPASTWPRRVEGVLAAPLRPALRIEARLLAAVLLELPSFCRLSGADCCGSAPARPAVAALPAVLAHKSSPDTIGTIL